MEWFGKFFLFTYLYIFYVTLRETFIFLNIRALDLDDFTGRCGQGKHPLLKVIHAELEKNDNTEIDREFYLKKKLQ